MTGVRIALAIVGLLLLAAVGLALDADTTVVRAGHPPPTHPVGFEPTTTTTSSTTTTTTSPPRVRAASVAPRVASVATNDIAGMIRAHWTPLYGAVVAEQAVGVASCETGGTFDPAATGRLGERGLFQLHPTHRGWIDAEGYGWDRMWEPGPNIAAAAALYGRSGWRPWSCRP